MRSSGPRIISAGVTSDDSYSRGKKPVGSSGVFAKTLLLIWLPLKLACSSKVCRSAKKLNGKLYWREERPGHHHSHWHPGRSSSHALHRLVQPTSNRLSNLIRRVLLGSMVPAHSHLAVRRPGAIDLVLLWLFRAGIGLHA